MWHLMTNEVVKGESEQTLLQLGHILIEFSKNQFQISLYINCVNLTATYVMRVDCQTPVVDDYQESVDKRMEQ